ncbi:DUF602-domain-containing protein [Neolentinus lepideus HHB14362 ss-1]|uniref:DUF602-domain-containing protein n=1 Tax=Neolentinus lepideus HHB14362 ss-1 TaxID=1314782 RepID=A0A165RWG5_9AGAM|nr:DUF602-domain-containing protein [Neolentinus lepideus HHB14362 ss-1]
MGNDGGSIPDRRDLVRTKAKAEQADKANQTRARWFFCALSKRPLQEPIVSCALGRLYNKDALLEFLLDRKQYGDGEAICGHIRSLKDVKQLKLTLNPTTASKSAAPAATDSPDERPQFVCPLTFKEMNGAQPFVYLSPCGCVFSLSGLKSLGSSSPKEGGASPSGSGDEGKKEKDGAATKDAQLELCPQCGAKYSKSEDIITLNPSPEEEERLRSVMERKRAAEPQKKGKKRKAGAAEGTEAPGKKKKASPTPAPGLNPNIAASSRAVVTSLAMEEAKRKAGMSEAVKSLYGDPSKPKNKETFMTMGTFTRYA